MPGGGAAAHQRVRGSGGVSASGGLQAAAAGAQSPGGPAAGPTQRKPGRRALRPEGRLRDKPVDDLSSWYFFVCLFFACLPSGVMCNLFLLS